jgi:hypothetical protein
VNLHGITRAAITSVNPDIVATLLQSTGYDTDAAGHRTPTYSTTTGMIQVQALTTEQIKRMDFINIQGVFRSVYLYGDWSGIVRADKTGGDILQFPEQAGGPVRSWKVVETVETWPDWSRVIVVLQTS